MFSVSQWNYFHLLDCLDRSHYNYLFKSFSIIAEASCQQTVQANASCLCWHHLCVVNVPVSLYEKITVFWGMMPCRLIDMYQHLQVFQWILRFVDHVSLYNLFQMKPTRCTHFIVVLKPCSLYLLYVYIPTKLHLNLLN